MQQHNREYFASRTPPPPANTGGLSVKIQLFQNINILHIKFKYITNAAKWQQIFCRQTPPTQPLGSIGQNSTCSEHGPVAYQIKEESQMQQHGRKYFASRLPPANTGV